MKKSQVNVIRWFTRIIGSLLVLFVVLMFLGYAIDPQDTGRITFTEIPLFIGMIAMLLGILVAWFNEGLGAALTIGGFLFFAAVELVIQGSFDTWLLMIFPAIGLLFLFCRWQSKKST